MFSIYADGVSIYDPSVKSFYLFNPQVKLEFGKAGSLEFSVPPTNLYYNSFTQLKTIVTADLDGVEIFRGRVFSIEQDFNKFKKVYCEGDLSYLVDSVQKGEAYNGTTRALFNTIISRHNARVEEYKQFTVGEVTIEDRPIKLAGKTEENLNVGDIDYKQIAINSIVDEWNNTFDCIQSWLIDYCGGYLRTRRVGNITYIDYLENYSTTSTQTISFGNNLLDLTGEANAEDLFTVLVPIGDENLTISSVNNGSDELVDINAVAKYGRIIRTHVFSNVNNASTLIENGRRYLAENVNLPITYTVKAIDLHLLDDNVSAIRVGDRVKLDSPPHGVSEYLTCTEIEYDLANPENNSYTFGNPKQTLTQRFKEDQRKSNDTSSIADSVGSVGSASAGAGIAAAAEDAQKRVDDGLKDFYDAYIQLDPEHGSGSLLGIYKDYENTKLVLSRQVGINFDAEEGNVNLFSLTQKVNENTGAIESALAQTTSFTGIVDGQLTALQQMIAKVDKEGVKQATWEVFANETETAIRGKADSIDVETLRGNLGGTIEEIDEMKNTLTKKVGIQWDTEQGTVDLFTLNRQVDEQGKVISQHSTDIVSVSDEVHSEISLIAKSVTENGESIAQLGVLADDLGTTIKGVADKLDLKADKAELGGIQVLTDEVDNMKDVITKQVGIDWDTGKGTLDLFTMNNRINDNTKQITNSSTRITQLSNDIVAMQTIEATYGDNVAKIMAIANDNSSALLLKADKLVVETDLTTIRGDLKAIRVDIDNLKAKDITAEQIRSAISSADLISVKSLSGSSITASNFYVTNGPISSRLASDTDVDAKLRSIVTSGHAGNAHTHVLSVSDDGTVTIGYATSGTQSFNIKATKAYIDGVAAAAAAANVNRIVIDRDEDSTDFYSEAQKTISVRIVAEAFGDNDKSLKKQSKTVLIDAGLAYQHGLRKGAEDQQQAIDEAVAAVNVSQLKVASMTYNSSTHNTAITLEADLTNNKTYTRPSSVIISGADAYAAGRQSVLITGIAKETVGGVTELLNGDHTLNVYVKATANNNEVLRQTIKTGTLAWNKGNEAGYKSGVEDGTKGVTVDVTRRTDITNEKYDTTTHKTTLYLIATGSNGATKEKSFTTGTAAYNAGKTDGVTEGKNAVTITSLIKRTDVTNNEVYNADTHKTTLYLTAKASNGATKNASFSTGTAAYEDGLSKGASGVTISSIDQAVVANSFNATNKTIDYKITAKASNGKTKIETLSMNAGQAVSSVTIDSISYSITSQDYTAHTISTELKGVASNGKTKVVNWTLGTTAHYNKGRDDYKPTSVNLTSRTSNGKTQIYTESTNSITAYLSATCKNAAGATVYTSNNSYTIDATAAYDAGIIKGKNAVDIKSVSSVSYDTTEDKSLAFARNNTVYDGSYVRGKLKVELNNPTFTTRIIKVSLSGSDAYDAGKTAGITEGKNAVDINSVSSVSYDTAENHSLAFARNNTEYDGSYIRGKLQVKLNNPTFTTRIIKVSLSGSDAYDAGKTAGITEGKNAVDINSVSSVSYDTTEDKSLAFARNNTVYDGSYVRGKLKVELNNPTFTTRIIKVSLSGSDAYDAGYAQGKNDYEGSGYVEPSVGTPYLEYNYDPDGYVDAVRARCVVNGTSYHGDWWYL